MIKYKKGIFGLNLLFRMHGSAIYRAVVPATLSSLIFCAWSLEWEKPPQSELLHPYAAGVIIGGITFLLVFRVTQSYGRYCKLKYCILAMYFDAHQDDRPTLFTLVASHLDFRSQGKQQARYIECKVNGWMLLFMLQTITCSRANTMR